MGSHTGWPVAKPLWIRPWTWKYLTIVIISPKKIHSLSTITETFEKHSSIFNIKKRKLDSVFSFRKTTQEEVSKVIRNLYTKKLSVPPKSSNWILIFSQIWFTNILTTALIKVNFWVIWNMLILFQYIGKITNAKKKTTDL